MDTITEDTEKRVAYLKQEVPTRGFERHPSLIKNIADLPIQLQSPAVMKLASTEAIHTIIVFPPQIQRGWHYVPKQALLFTETAVIHLAASIWPDQEPQITYLNGCGLMYMKVSLLLLYGSLEIVAEGSSVPTQLGLEFNTMGWDYMVMPLRQLLLVGRASSNVQTDEAIYTPSVQEAVEKLPLKFFNGIQLYGLLPGESLEGLVFQHGIWQRRLLLLRRPILANTLLLLSSNYVVVIQEELGVELGWIVSYIPRRNIIGMQSQPCGLWHELAIQLQRGDQAVDYKLLLTNETVEAWRAVAEPSSV